MSISYKPEILKKLVKIENEWHGDVERQSCLVVSALDFGSEDRRVWLLYRLGCLSLHRCMNRYQRKTAWMTLRWKASHLGGGGGRWGGELILLVDVTETDFSADCLWSMFNFNFAVTLFAIDYQVQLTS